MISAFGVEHISKARGDLIRQVSGVPRTVHNVARKSGPLTSTFKARSTRPASWSLKARQVELDAAKSKKNPASNFRRRTVTGGGLTTKGKLAVGGIAGGASAGAGAARKPKKAPSQSDDLSTARAKLEQLKRMRSSG